MELTKLTPFLWFNNQATEAANFYCSIFKNSKIINPSPMMTVFDLEGQRFMAGNFGPQFQFNEAISIFVTCDNQEEVDYFWEKLTADGGQPGRCGWLKDKFGLSWQIIPSAFTRMAAGEPAKSQKMFAAMMKMNKMDIQQLEDAYNGK